MPNYKDTNNTVHFLDSAEFEPLLPTGCVPITDEEAESLVPKQSAQDIIYAQIAEIESAITPRRLREATLTAEGKTWFAARDAEIAALRAKL